MSYQIVKVWEGRMGFNQRPVFEAWVNGELVAFAPRKWIAAKIAQAIVDGHIAESGDAMMAWVRWAAKNDRAAYDRLPENI